MQGRTVGIEWDANACATATAAGHLRVCADVRDVSTASIITGPVEGYIGSPPCQSFSTAGKGLGKLDLPALLAHVAKVAKRGRWVNYARDGWHDDRSPLVLEPLRRVLNDRPRWVALEQVPAVLPLWQAYAAIFEARGYRTATGILSAEEYGVPQTRRRAILVAHREHDVSLPAPIMRRYRKGVAQQEGDTRLEAWVSMAEALGHGLIARPSFTVCGGGTATGGAEPFASSTRKALALALAEGTYVQQWMLARQTGSTARPQTDPAVTVTASGVGHGVTVWTDRPGGYTPGEIRDTARITVQEAAILQSFPVDYSWHGGPKDSAGPKYQQIGDAVPPLLGVAVLGELLGVEWRKICRTAYRPNPGARAAIVARRDVPGRTEG